MFRKLVLAAAFCAAALASAANATEIPGSQFTAGNWAGAGYTNNRGEFSHCAISVRYPDRGGMYGVLFAATRDDFRMSITRTSWQMPVGAEYPIDITVDGQLFRPTGIARVIAPYQVVIQLRTDVSTFQAMMRGNWLAVPQLEVQFSLAGSSAALANMLRCWATYSGYAASRNTNPFAEARRTNPTNPFQGRSF
jgi:hypothetical protein